MLLLKVAKGVHFSAFKTQLQTIRYLTFNELIQMPNNRKMLRNVSVHFKMMVLVAGHEAITVLKKFMRWKR